MNAISSVVRRSPLISFFVLTYALTWGLGLLLRGEPTAAFSPIFTCGPLVAAVVILAITEGRVGLRDLLDRLLRWRVAPAWYGIVLGLPLVLVAIAAVFNSMFGGTPLDWGKAPGPVQMVLFLAIFLFVPILAPLGEEPGWRGFALPRLLAGRSLLTASLILGVIWSLWHLPLVVANPALRPPAPFLLAVPALAVLFTWVFIHTRESLFIAVLFHAWYDLAIVFVLAMQAPADSERFVWGLAVAQWVAVLVVFISARQRWLAAPQPPVSASIRVPRADLASP